MVRITRKRRILPVALALALGASGLAFAAGKLDKKLTKQLGKDLNKVAALKRDTEADDPAITAAVATIGQVGKADNKAAVDLLMKLGLGTTFQSGAAEVAVLDAIKDAVSGMTDPEARKRVSYYMEKKGKKDWRLQVLLVEALMDYNTDDAFGLLVKLLTGKKTDERVVVAIVQEFSATRKNKVVSPLIDAFGAWKKRAGVPFQEIQVALNNLTGEAFTTLEDWKSFWEIKGKDFDPTKVRTKKEIGGTQERKNPKLFGSEVVSKRVVIILDISYSMLIKDPGPPDQDDDEEEGGPGSRERDANKPKKPAAPVAGYTGPSLEPTDKNYGKLPKDRMRIARAKKQLAKLVNKFDPRVEFNLVEFSTKSSAWKPGKILRASNGNKRDALKFIASLKPKEGNLTCALKGLEKAFECKEADTIYFISDGAPTDTNGKPVQAKGRAEIIDRVVQLNKFRKVKVHAIGLRGAYGPFMKKLAKATNGTYTQVD